MGGTVSPMELSQAIEFAKQRQQGVLTTIRRDGRPQMSNILYAMDDDGLARISITAPRAKAKNLQRDPRSLLYVLGDNFFQYVVLDGRAELSAVATRVDDEVADELVDLYRALGREHPDWDEYRRSTVAEQRLVARFRPKTAQGVLPTEAT